MVKEVVQDPNPILHKITLPISVFSFNTLNKLVKDMKDTLKDQNGVGLAAPQISESLSIFVIPDDMSPKVRDPRIPFSLIKPLYPTVFINPEITYYSKEKDTADEGCLSVRGMFKPTQRSYRVKIKTVDQKGHKLSISAEGLLARIFQHEIDHLNGVLFIERL